MKRKQTLYVCSPHAFVRHFNKKVLLYHSLYLSKIIGDKSLEKIFLRFKKPRVIDSSKLKGEERKTIKLLLENKFLTTRGEITKDMLDYRNMLPKSHKVNTLYLFPSDDCNLSCKYCIVDSAKNSSFVPGNMSQKTAKKAIDLFMDIYNKECDAIQVTMYGGEPLLNRNLVKFIIKYTKKLHREKKIRKPLVISMVTNGTLVDKDIAKFFVQNRVDVGFSIDGTKECNDRMRVYKKTGKGTWDDIVRGVRNFIEAGGNPTFSYTIGKHNYKDIEKHLQFLIDEFGMRALGFNLLINVDKKNPSYIEPEISAKRIIEAFKFLRQKGVYDERMLRKVRSFVEEKPYLYECAGCGQQIVVNPKGDVGLCQIFINEGKFILGNIKDRDIKSKIEDGPLIKKWLERTPINMHQCQDCIGLAFCGGGCMVESDKKHGDIWELDERFCVHTKKTLEWLMKDLVQRIERKTK